MEPAPDGFRLARSTSTRASAASLMERIARPSTWPDWVPEISSTSATGLAEAGEDVSGRARMLGFEVDGRAHVSEVGATSFTQDVVVGVRMIARYEVEPTSDGAIVRHELIVSAPKGSLGRVLAILLRARLRVMQRRLLRNLVTQAERDARVDAPSR